MSSINVNTDTKREFDELQPEDYTQDEFVAELLKVYQTKLIELYQLQVEDGLIDPEQVAEQVEEQIAAKVELAAHRGVKSGVESVTRE